MNKRPYDEGSREQPLELFNILKAIKDERTETINNSLEITIFLFENNFKTTGSNTPIVVCSVSRVSRT